MLSIVMLSIVLGYLQQHEGISLHLENSCILEHTEYGYSPAFTLHLSGQALAKPNPYPLPCLALVLVMFDAVSLAFKPSVHNSHLH